MTVGTAVLWFRRDLRLDDLPALVAAGEGGRTVVPLFVVDDAVLGAAGPNRRRFLSGALRALDDELGGSLVLRRGRPEEVVPAVAAEVDASLVVASADFGPYGSARDRAVEEALASAGRRLLPSGSPYGVTPGRVRGTSGSPLRVFSAFRRAWEKIGVECPIGPPAVRFARVDNDTMVDDLDLGVAEPGQHGLPSWWEGLPLGVAAALPPAGPAAAEDRLDAFAAGSLEAYAVDRDRPAVRGTSGLSPYLRFGCIHPRTVLSRLGDGPGAARMRAELAWRDFYADVLWHRPDSSRRPLQRFGEHLAWDAGAQAQRRFARWAMGRTGYPLVDAGMRQLLAEGWMHNRLRMVTASFLVKDLHLDWRLGARWFMWHLVDGDLASNQHGWQWVAGTGTDAAPFHRVLNPRLQQDRFDPEGVYVRRYVEEFSTEANPGSGAAPPGYPEPVVDHARERLVALQRFDEARRVAAAEH